MFCHVVCEIVDWRSLSDHTTAVYTISRARSLPHKFTARFPPILVLLDETAQAQSILLHVPYNFLFPGKTFFPFSIAAFNAPRSPKAVRIPSTLCVELIFLTSVIW